jgi:hypothetical protein
VKRIFLALPLLLLASCQDDAEQFGLTQIDGRPAVVSAPCRKQDVVRFQIAIPVGQIVGDADDKILWRAVPDEPRPAAFVTPIGSAPGGFATTVPFSGTLPDRELAFGMEWSYGEGHVIFFRPGALRPGEILTDASEVMTPDRFIAYASDGCGQAGLVDGAAAVIRSIA